MKILFYLNQGWKRYVAHSPEWNLLQAASSDPECRVVECHDFNKRPDVSEDDILVADLAAGPWLDEIRCTKISILHDMHRWTREEYERDYYYRLPKFDFALSAYRFAKIPSTVFAPAEDERKNIIVFPHSVPDEPCPEVPRFGAGVTSGVPNNTSYPFRAWVLSLGLPSLSVIPHPGYDSHEAMYAAKQAFFERLASYKILVTGTGVGYAVAKYVEGPYAGCLLIAERVGPEDGRLLGLQHGTNCFLYEQGDAALFEQYVGALEDWERYKQIAEAGRRLVMSRHTASCRLAYLKRIIAHYQSHGIPTPAQQEDLFLCP